MRFAGGLQVVCRWFAGGLRGKSRAGLGVCARPDGAWCVCQVMLSHDFPVSYVCTVCIVSLCKQITELRARWRERDRAGKMNHLLFLE